MYLCDIHTHSLISPDSEAPLADMAQAAIDAGLDELCVTDHHDLLDWDGTFLPHFNWTGAWEQYQAVREQVEGKLTLRLGVELGSTPYDPAAARQSLAEGGTDVDFVLGSLHNWIGLRDNRDLYFLTYTDMAMCRQAMDNYLESCWSLVSQYPDCYDSLAHITYPLRYMRRDGYHIPIQEYEEQVRTILTKVARTGHAMEVNTWKGASLEEEWTPLLRWFKECGGRYVTLGSDAHAPADMAKGIREVTALVKASGFDHVTTYHKREPILHEL